VKKFWVSILVAGSCLISFEAAHAAKDEAWQEARKRYLMEEVLKTADVPGSQAHITRKRFLRKYDANQNWYIEGDEYNEIKKFIEENPDYGMEKRHEFPK
jgi:hypothetical protein